MLFCITVIRERLKPVLLRPHQVRALGLPDGLQCGKNGYLKRGDGLIFEGIEQLLKLEIAASEGTNAMGSKAKITGAFLIQQVASYQRWRG